MLLKKFLNIGLNVATGGGWAVARWIGRRLKGNPNKPSFLGRVATFVVGTAVYSAIIGKINPLEVLNSLGQAILYLCLLVLNSAGGEGRLPGAEDAKAKGFIAKAKDAVDDRVERLEASLKRKAEEHQRKLEQEIARHKKELDERDLAGEIARRKHEAEAEIARAKLAGEAEIARRAAEIEAKGRQMREDLAAKERELAAKAKAEIVEHTPSPWEMMFGSGGSGSKPDPNPLKAVCPQCMTVVAWPLSSYENNGRHGDCGTEMGRIGRIARFNPQAGSVHQVKCMFGCDNKGRVVTGSVGDKLFRCQDCSKGQYVCEGEAKYAAWWLEQKPERDKIAKESVTYLFGTTVPPLAAPPDPTGEFAPTEEQKKVPERKPPATIPPASSEFPAYGPVPTYVPPRPTYPIFIPPAKEPQ